MTNKYTLIIISAMLCALIPFSGAMALTSSVDDVARSLKNLVIIIVKKGKVVKEHEIFEKISTNIDDFIPYIKELPDNERIKVLLAVAEENKVLKATDKIRINREIVQGKYSEDELIEAIKVTQKTRKPINSKYAGTVLTSDDLAKISPELAKKYPDGVKFTDDGYPDFAPYAKTKISSDKLSGNRVNDAKLANREAGHDRTPEGYVWHHHQDCKTILLVPLDLHEAVRHSGGAEKLLKGGERCPL